MINVLRYGGQAAVYLLIAVLFAVFADWPPYVAFPPDQAQIKIALAHGAAHKVECRRRTAEELAALPANMRRPLDCPRERLPVVVELEIDGALMMHESAPPSGLSGDGPSKIYRRFAVPAGHHSIVARLRDSNRAEGYDYERRAEIELAPLHIFVIDFRADTGGFLFFPG